ncbi:MAG: hypothetical protein GY811_03000 [Myxococcales bacterium]|nr:hypothetical protein [Myxococcales bacterium]
MKATGGAFLFREVDRVRVIGRSAAAAVYELCGAAGNAAFTPEDSELFAEGLAAYRAQDWEGCKRSLQRFLERHPEDGPRQTLMRRIPDLRKLELSKHWDGVFAQLQK